MAPLVSWRKNLLCTHTIDMTCHVGYQYAKRSRPSEHTRHWPNVGLIITLPYVYDLIPANTTRWSNAGLMLAQRRRMIGSTCRVCWDVSSAGSTLGQSWTNTNVIPANTRRWPNAGLLLRQRRRRWTNINPTLDRRLVIAVIHWNGTYPTRRWTSVGLKLDQRRRFV